MMPTELRHDFTVNWHVQHQQSWATWLAHLRVLPVQALEIGSFEGRSSLWLCEHILLHPESTITCIDPFEASPQRELLNQIDPKRQQMLSEAETRFRKNTARLRTTGKLKWLKASSQRALPYLNANNYLYDLIYIDGVHHAAAVQQDSLMAWSLLKVGGIVIWDDYLWKSDHRSAKRELARPKLAIDAFLACFEERYDLISKSSQVCIRKSLS